MNYEKLLNKTVASVPPSGIRKYFDIAAEMKDAISLGVGEPDFETPWAMCEAAIYSLESGETHYTSNQGRTDLREKICEYLSRRYHINYDPVKETLVTVGLSEAIDIALRSLITPGDEVIVPDPSYVAYAPGILFAGGNPVAAPTYEADDFRLMPETLRSLISEKTRALILPYPNNPTGAVMTRENLQAIADVLQDTDIIVLSDEVYSELVYGDFQFVSFASLPGMWERTITMNGFSKAFAMTGWRIGYACGPREIIGMMTKIHQYTIMCAPTQGQVAAYEALRRGLDNDFADIEHMRQEYDRRRRFVVREFRDMGLRCFEPLGAFYAFPSIQSTGMNAEEFCEKLLFEKAVATVPGTAFGSQAAHNIRCSYASSMENLKEALYRIRDFVQTLG